MSCSYKSIFDWEKITDEATDCSSILPYSALSALDNNPRDDCLTMFGVFCVLRRGGVGGMGCRSFDVRVVCDEFAVCVGSLCGAGSGSTGSAWDWRIWSGLRRFCWSCVGSALGYVLVAAWLCALSCWKTTRIGQVGSWAEVAKIYRCRYSLGGAARIHGMGSTLCVSVCVGCAAAYFVRVGCMGSEKN